MNTTTKIASVVGGLAVVGGGGAVITDAQINPYTDTGNQLQIEHVSTTPHAGNVETFLPKDRVGIVLSKWNGEAVMHVNPVGTFSPGSRQFLTKKMQWKGTNEDVEAYPIDATSSMEDGGFEMQVVLNGKPGTNDFQFTIPDASQYDFFYQPPLNVEMASSTCTETDCGGAHRPDDVVGSYAVYYKAHSNYIVGGTNYATGKAFHIFRPKATDANGNWTWANLSYKDGVLSVTVPQSFLDTATYPVTVDPTFGYTTAGASTESAGSPSGTNNPAGLLASLTEAGFVSKITAYVNTTIIAKSIACKTYSGSAGSRGSLLGTTNGSNVPTTAAWTDFSFASALSLSSASYWLEFEGYGGDGPGTTIAQIAYDTGGASNTGYLVSDLGSPAYNTEQYSIYATYTNPPTVSTVAASSITTSSATLNGNITADGGASITQYGFAWGTNSSLSGGDTATTTNGAGTTGTYSTSETGLSSNTTYYFRAYATNGTGTAYGSILNFTTLAPVVNPSPQIRMNNGRVRVNNGKIRIQ